MQTKRMNKQKLLRTIALLAVLAAAVFAFSTAASAIEPGGSQDATVTLTLYGVTINADSTVAGAGYTVKTTRDPTPVSVYEQTYTAAVGPNGEVLINVNRLPSGYTLKVTSADAIFKQEGLSVLVQEVTKNVSISLSAVKSSPSPSPSGGGASIWEQLQDTRAVITTDVTRLYSGIPFFAATAVNLAEIQNVYPVYAAELAEKFAAAEAAGYKLVNSRGAPALAVLEHPDEKIIKEQFCKVYEVTPVYAGAKITQVEIPVPMTDITASGLTYQDVNIYHGVDLPGVTGAGSGAADLWIPLEILNITFDEKNYYFTAATDGASPFGVLIKHFEPEGTEPGTLPTPVPKTAVPLAGLLAGLGAAGVLLGLKRK